jgi:hypothetical protein
MLLESSSMPPMLLLGLADFNFLATVEAAGFLGVDGDCRFVVLVGLSLSLGVNLSELSW